MSRFSLSRNGLSRNGLSRFGLSRICPGTFIIGLTKCLSGVLIPSQKEDLEKIISEKKN